MSTTEIQIKNLVLSFFEKFNSYIIEKDGIYDIQIPEKIFHLFKRSRLTITFDKIEKPDSCEYIAPGNNILLLITNECIKMGSVISVKLINQQEKQSSKIRFYFYVIFESIMTKSSMHHVDVDIASLKLSPIDDHDIDFNNNVKFDTISSDKIIDCYILAREYIENSLSEEISIFKEKILMNKNDDMKKIKEKYASIKQGLNDEYFCIQTKNDSVKKFHNLVDLNEHYINEEKNYLANLNNKYNIRIEFALTSIIVMT